MLVPSLQVCPPAWFAANVAQHPLRLQQLLGAFLEGFALDPACAGVMLYAAAPPAGAATSYAPGSRPGSGEAGAAGGGSGGGQGGGAEATQQQPGQAGQQMAASGGAVVLLPRMPLGLALITTARTHEAVAAAVRAAAALAAAADAAPGAGGTALRSLVDGCLSRLQQLTEAAADSADSGSSGSGRRAHMRIRQQQQRGAAAAGLTGQVPWQLQAASLVAVLAELLLGASPAWQPSWGVGAAAAPDTGGGELEALAAAAVQELVSEAVWSLPTSAAVEGPDTAGGAAGSAPLLLESSLGQQRLTVQQLGCNALLQRAAIECCGTAARALGPRFAQNGRLLRAALLPLVEKLGEGRVAGGRAGTQLHRASAPARIQLPLPAWLGRSAHNHAPAVPPGALATPRS